ncbi:hypothetical protein [Microbacterium rhizophilus]|uniref:hypothetical protein n=1 Tax=Microbacterium rhizophilus TaxID=3138934 RepID=UPI0031EA698F
MGSENPASASGSPSTPVRNSASETPHATIATGTRLLASATSRITNVASIACMRQP